ncbi:MAG: type II toxin-antitoxin system prevent-host-death family antitoxin [bacterium]
MMVLRHGELERMTVPVAEAKRQFSNLLKRVAYGGEIVTIGSRGRPEAALISVAELARLRAIEMEQDVRQLEEAVRTSTGTVGLRDLLEASGVAESRARYEDSAKRVSQRQKGRRSKR